MEESRIDEYTKEDHFAADKDIMDSLKMEYSSTSPQEQELIKDLSTDIGVVKTYLRSFHNWMSLQLQHTYNTH
jgi:hypothetical protein